MFIEIQTREVQNWLTQCCELKKGGKARSCSSLCHSRHFLSPFTLPCSSLDSHLSHPILHLPFLSFLLYLPQSFTVNIHPSPNISNSSASLSPSSHTALILQAFSSSLLFLSPSPRSRLSLRLFILSSSSFRPPLSLTSHFSAAHPYLRVPSSYSSSSFLDTFLHSQVTGNRL